LTVIGDGGGDGSAEFRRGEKSKLFGKGGGGGVVIGDSGVGAVETCRAGGGGAAAVFVGGGKMSFEVCEGSVGGCFLAPFMASGEEEAGVFNDGVVAVADGSCVGDSVVAGDGEADGFGELVEDGVDGLFSSLGLFHGEKVSFKFGGSDIAVGGPEISEKLKCGEVAPTVKIRQLIVVR